MRLRLSHKGLLLVSGVLLFELVLVAMFAGLLDRSEEELEHRLLANSVIAHLGEVKKLFLDAEIADMSQQGRAVFARSEQMLPYEFHALRLFLKGNTTALRSLSKAEAGVTAEITRLNQTRKSVADGKLNPSALIDYSQFRITCNQLLRESDLISQYYRRPIEFVPDPETQSRRMFENYILVVVILNAIVAVSITLFFMQGIVGRLQILTDNSVRFARGEQLNPPLEGTDEIALLDKTLHETISERQLAENLLKSSEARTRSLIENMPVGVITVDEEGIIESINPRTEDIFGYEFQEIVGDHLMALFRLPPELDNTTFTQTIKQKGIGGTPIHFESRRKNGDIFPVEMSLSEFDSIDGKRFLAIIQDITERQEAERLKQELLAMVSHDLRSPLTSVQGVLTLLGKGMYGKLTETGDTRVRAAEASLSRLVHLVDDILDLEKMEAGKLQFNLDVVSLSTVVDRSIEYLYDFAQQTKLKFETPSANVDLYVDEERILQVFINLLSNAIKFAPPESTITIGCAEVDDDVEITVADQGPGIKPEHIENIFQRFHQSEQPNGAKSHRGTGLGLAICKAIVEAHDGTVGIRSEYGKGSTFWFRVPKQSKAEKPRKQETALKF